ncbi:MAG: hypothetical protein V1820_00365 [archaeon]
MRPGEPPEKLWFASAAILLLSILIFRQLPLELFLIHCSASAIFLSACRFFQLARAPIVFSSIVLAGNLFSFLALSLASFQSYPRVLTFLLFGAYSFFLSFPSGILIGLLAEFFHRFSGRPGSF